MSQSSLQLKGGYIDILNWLIIIFDDRVSSIGASELKKYRFMYVA